MKRYIRSATSSMSVEERIDLASSSNDPKILARLANDENEHVRSAVAESTDDPELLAKLADDADWWVRCTVAERTTDTEFLARLADDEDYNVRVAVARRTSDPEILAKLAEDEEWSVREAAAESTDDPKILAKLANDDNEYVRQAAAKRLRKSADSKKGKNSTSNSWPSSDWWYSLDNESFEVAWQDYLSAPEDEVNSELQIFPEPSVQGSMGELFVYDESDQDRKGENDDWSIDWQDYLDWQVEAAATSKNASQYKQKYRKFMKDLCGI